MTSAAERATAASVGEGTMRGGVCREGANARRHATGAGATASRGISFFDRPHRPGARKGVLGGEEGPATGHGR
jgi:hypothetical protein